MTSLLSELPNFTYVKREQHPIILKEAHIACPANNTNEVFWTFNDTVITDNDIFSVNLENSIYTTDLDGIYVCHAKHYYGDSIEKIDINVTGYCKRLYNK